MTIQPHKQACEPLTWAVDSGSTALAGSRHRRNIRRLE